MARRHNELSSPSMLSPLSGNIEEWPLTLSTGLYKESPEGYLLFLFWKEKGVLIINSKGRETTYICVSHLHMLWCPFAPQVTPKLLSRESIWGRRMRTQHTNSAVPSNKKRLYRRCGRHLASTYLAAGRLLLLASAELEQVAQAQGKSRSSQKQGQRAAGRDPFQQRATRFEPTQLHRVFSRGEHVAHLSQSGNQIHSGGARRDWADLCPSDEERTAANRRSREDGVTWRTGVGDDIFLLVFIDYGLR